MPERVVFKEGVGWTRGDQVRDPDSIPVVDLTVATVGRVKLSADGRRYGINSSCTHCTITFRKAATKADAYLSGVYSRSKMKGSK